METLLVIIPVDKLYFLLHKTFSSFIWDDIRLSMSTGKKYSIKSFTERVIISTIFFL